MVSSPDRNRRTWVLDVTIRGAQQQHLLSSPAPGRAARDGEAAKCRAYGRFLAGRPEYQFRPISFDTMGGFGSSARRFIRDVSDARAEHLHVHDGDTPCLVHSYTVRLSVAVQLALATCIHRRTAPLHTRPSSRIPSPPLYTPLHTLPDILSWDRPPADEDIPSSLQDEFDVTAALAAAAI